MLSCVLLEIEVQQKCIPNKVNDSKRLVGFGQTTAFHIRLVIWLRYGSKRVVWLRETCRYHYATQMLFATEEFHSLRYTPPSLRAFAPLRSVLRVRDSPNLRSGSPKSLPAPAKRHVSRPNDTFQHLRWPNDQSYIKSVFVTVYISILATSVCDYEL